MVNRHKQFRVERTTIPIDKDVRDKLRAEKEGGETYSDVIVRLLEQNES